MLTVLFGGIVIGLALGVLADYIYLQHGWKPTLALTLVLLVVANVVIWQTDLDGIDFVWVMLAYGSTRFLVEPLLRKHIEP